MQLLKLLLISNVEAYQNSSTDVEESYRQLAEDPRFGVFHLPTSAVRPAAPLMQDALLFPTVRVTGGFCELSTSPFKLKRLEDFDLVLCRTLKPFPPECMASLETWVTKVPFINDPFGISAQLAPDFLVRVARDLWSLYQALYSWRLDSECEPRGCVFTD